MRSYASAALILIPLCSAADLPPMGQPAAAYRALVQSYREEGHADIGAVLAMRHDVVSAAVEQAVSGAAPWPWEELRAAAMLHSEACLAATDKARACEFHIMQAERLLERTVALSARQEDFAWRWYRVMPHMLNAVGQKSLARGVDRQATEKWRSDRVRADYLQGLELESKGSREAVLQTPSGPNPYDKGGIRASYFAKAGELFTRAFKQRPDLTVAALHLGRIRMLQGNGAEAALLFRSALTDVDPAVRYLASLFLGTLEERDQRFDAAEKLYSEALDDVPYGQSAPLALSELLSRTGREADARRALAARLLRMDTEVLEPFWAYGPDDVPATRFDLLRVEVWK
jgi:tetratricopeptide (TPR) repeat protein